jgi:hypothetical protein
MSRHTARLDTVPTVGLVVVTEPAEIATGAVSTGAAGMPSTVTWRLPAGETDAP